MTKLLLVIAAIVIVGGGALVLTHDTNTTSTKTTSNTSPASTSKPKQSIPEQTNPAKNTSDQKAAATIVYDGKGFSPSSLTVKAGTAVGIKNTSNQALQFDSDPHPAHTDDTDLNANFVSPGETKTITVVKTGTFGYHNHLIPSQTGSITIQ
jgi:plastocyanin